jgi:hypothetical protein
MAPGAPLRLKVREVSLADFFARLIVNPEGRLVLQDLVSAPDKGSPTAAQGVAVQASAPAEAVPVHTASATDPVIDIGPIRLVNGRVAFSDRFIKPHYSADLSELVMGEPLIAAKVLATVNGAFYGLHKPVTSIGQAVTFLGINTVRSICLQYMLAEAFKPKLAEAQQAFDRIWKASAVASEMAVRLGKALRLGQCLLLPFLEAGLVTLFLPLLQPVVACLLVDLLDFLGRGQLDDRHFLGSLLLLRF